MNPLAVKTEKEQFMILIIFDTVFGNTGKVAGMLKEALTQKGEAVEMVSIAQVTENNFPSADMIIFGSPTRAFRPTPNMQSFVRAFKGLLKDKKVACFDTRMDVVEVNNKFLTFMAKHFGYANDFFMKAFKKAHAQIVCEPGNFYVKEQAGPLKDDTQTLVQAWAEKLLSK